MQVNFHNSIMRLLLFGGLSLGPPYVFQQKWRQVQKEPSQGGGRGHQVEAGDIHECGVQGVPEFPGCCVMLLTWLLQCLCHHLTRQPLLAAPSSTVWKQIFHCVWALAFRAFCSSTPHPEVTEASLIGGLSAPPPLLSSPAPEAP